MKNDGLEFVIFQYCKLQSVTPYTKVEGEENQTLQTVVTQDRSCESTAHSRRPQTENLRIRILQMLTFFFKFTNFYEF